MAPNDALSADEIRSFLPKAYQGNRIEVFTILDSTNSTAKELSRNGALHGTLVIAEEQTAGRGRLGRSFYSPKGSGLYMSVILRPQKTAIDAQALTVTAAVAVSNAIEKLTGLSPSVKWVNDLYMNGRKICGILAEAVTDGGSGSMDCVILGIGVNCSTDNFPEDIRHKAGSLGVPVCRNALAAEIMSNLLTMTEKDDFSKIIEEYRRRSVVIGKDISYMRDGIETKAKALDISDSGNLIVRRSDGELETLSFGEISINGDMT